MSQVWSFNGTAFAIDLGGGFIQRQIPRYVGRNATTRPATIFRTANGGLTVQENAGSLQWKPVMLEFRAGGTGIPGAVMTQALLDVFKTAKNNGGRHTLILGGVTKNVLFDSTAGEPIQEEEITPPSEGDDISNGIASSLGRLYVGRIYFLELTS